MLLAVRCSWFVEVGCICCLLLVVVCWLFVLLCYVLCVLLLVVVGKRC